MRAMIAVFALLLSVNVAADTDEGVAAHRAGDYKTALKWYIKGAEQGHAKAQSSLGFMYFNGEATDVAVGIYFYQDVQEN